jgi:hypothetical protein
MKESTTLNPLLLTGIVLLTNAFIFLLIAASFSMFEFLGVVIGCLGAGIGLTVTGAIKSKPKKEQDKCLLN